MESKLAFTYHLPSKADHRKVYERGFGVHQWDISVARLNDLLAKVGR